MIDIAGLFKKERKYREKTGLVFMTMSFFAWDIWHKCIKDILIKIWNVKVDRIPKFQRYKQS